jgi:acyl-CoA thioester hydrolase
MGSSLTIPFSLDARVYYQDTDAGGVVYHSRYLDFFERARAEWLRGLGMESTILAEKYHVIFIVRAVNIEYVMPAKLDDKLAIVIERVDLLRAQFNLAQKIFVESNLVARADINLVCVKTSNFKPARFPQVVKNMLTVESSPLFNKKDVLCQ